MIPLSVGQEFSPQELVKELIYQGYEYNITSDNPGVFAHRGEVVDVWIPELPQPTRIHFGPKQIEKLSDIDPSTGKLVTSRKQINIIPPDISDEKKKAKKQQRDFSFLIDLLPGDFIVHVDHGIGKFTGLQKKTIANHEKEYFVIEYKGDDKLFVPIESADRIDKYIGGGKPPLHRLSGTSWYQITKKIKEDVEKTAKELLDLYAHRKLATARAAKKNLPEEHELADSFEYQETPDQLSSIAAVLKDLEKEHPMDRLVCGDVGFGKTEIAIRAAFKMVLSGYQVAILAPTTILAQQHYDTFQKRLEPFNIVVDVLSRFRSKDHQKKTIADLKKGNVDIIIGTHRILSKDVEFDNIGLLIIDEEQKFGVKHKEHIKKMKTDIHVLTLSATPIPRTLHFSLAGIRDMSVISTPPEGRLPIKTVINQYENDQVKSAVTKEVSRGGQVYYLYNKVETMPGRLKQLRKLLPGISIELAHGQMPEGGLSDVMHRFDIGEIDMLLCSTIIENGLDLPNVNTLIVENSTKFGLAQLYQLRGRIGRGHRQAYSYFMYNRLKPNTIRSKKEKQPQRSPRRSETEPLAMTDSVLSEKEPHHSSASGRIRTGQAKKPIDTILSEKEQKRLDALEEASELGSGFQIAMRDMEIRGVGNILGKTQHGNMRAIGLSFYERLLSQAIEEIKTGTKAPVISDITLDLPLEYGIPPELEPIEQKRMALYQRLANSEDLTELAKEKVIYTEKIQSPLLETFFDILEIKILGRTVGATSVTTSIEKNESGEDQQKCIIEFRNHSYAKNIDKLLEKYPQWKVGDKQLILVVKNQDWLSIIKNSFSILIKDSLPQK
ncbi:MAG: DEAD/DEAH box helicase [Candidatus Jacksonbacteria bacterium]|nr:DEAD/DEAH box helicase [Candidatus Jacksonbacteria bacterium]MBT6034035.1 DEAD/DEAH box helicase [Candidatus Jacksonbacteria bacterium]MBT6301342.1 DEAD/DEAH box helicase [Candidatus Jacksonbacteria bacterium]MBT6756984.1 DEAD/DEAH box helicase [Candidatus Jacksonbacteria bacterium]MBT6955580.1 DEAD/DEAH box helicase [Candidatus Jacksonbacteria bacterium]